MLKNFFTNHLATIKRTITGLTHVSNGRSITKIKPGHHRIGYTKKKKRNHIGYSDYCDEETLWMKPHLIINNLTRPQFSNLHKHNLIESTLNKLRLTRSNRGRRHKQDRNINFGKFRKIDDNEQYLVYGIMVEV